MSKTKAQKLEQIEELASKLQTSKAGVLSEFKGLTMEDLTAWRNTARKQGVSIQVVKNTLLTKAAEKAAIKDLNTNKIARQLALAVGEDEVILFKLVHKFTQANAEKIKIFAGLIDKKLVPATLIMQLASLPSGEELLAKLVDSMNVPISRFVRVLNGPMQGFYNVIKALQETKA